MKILYVLSGTQSAGGATKSFITLLYSALKEGHECYVITPGKEGVYYDLINSGINVISIKYRFNATDIAINPIYKLLNWLRWLRRKNINRIASRKLYKICKVLKPDIIHTNSSIINIGYLAASKLGIPHITHFREYGNLDFGFKIHGITKGLACNLSFSIAITKDIANHRKLKKESSKVIYNGICSEKDIRFTLEKRPFFLYAGRIQHTKGIEELIEAYLIYCKSNPNALKLYIAGDYDFKEGKQIKSLLDKLILDYGCCSMIKWLGERADVNDLMYSAYATIVPSFNEGFGRVMAEAMANGSLVLGRNTGGTKEQFDNGVEITGEEIGIRFNDVKELAASLAQITKKSIIYYNKMIQGSQEVVRRLYTVESYNNNIFGYYNEILSSKNK